MPTSDLEWTSLDTGDDSEEWQKILRLVEEQDIDWAYWSIDGYKYPGTTENWNISEPKYLQKYFQGRRRASDCWRATTAQWGILGWSSSFSGWCRYCPDDGGTWLCFQSIDCNRSINFIQINYFFINVRLRCLIFIFFVPVPLSRLTQVTDSA